MISEEEWLELKEREKYGMIVKIMKRVEKLENNNEGE